ncbi:hypothetical protein ACHAXN_003413 [Cyclotella atomus]
MAIESTDADEKHFDWSAKQGRILTDGGRALEYYTEANGFPFSAEECPHYHLERGETDVFKKWSQDFLASGRKHPIVGAWKRPLFASRWEYSTDVDETVFNIQTSTLFVDLRVPRSKPVNRWENMGEHFVRNRSSSQMLESLSDHDLRLYARQHIFGGFSSLSKQNDRPLCTRHHCIDWNYISGKPRPRPNKWYIEGNHTQNDKSFDSWIEWSYATDYYAQSYYHERWERLPGDEHGAGLRLAMRKRIIRTDYSSPHSDGIIVAVGDHFNYIIGRNLAGSVQRYPNASNLVELVDSAIANRDRSTAISYLTLHGGHGTISSGWIVDCAIQPWKHGKRLISCLETDADSMSVKVTGSSSNFRTWEVVLGGDVWDVYESSLSSAQELNSLLQKTEHVKVDSRL